MRIGGVVLSRNRPLDGAMGTELQTRFGAAGAAIVRWHRENPGDLTAVYRDYVAAGAQILTTNTLTALGERDGADLVRASVGLAWCAAPGPGTAVFVSLAPGGDPARLTVLAQAAAEAGCAAILIETAPRLSDLCAAVAAVRAARPGVPVVGSLVPNADGTATLGCGSGPGECAARLIEAGADAIGVNCAPPPAAFRFIAEVALRLPPDFPLLARPSAGIPFGNAVSLSYPYEPHSWAESALTAAAVLPNLLIGGCCGAGPRHIAALAAALSGLPS